MLHLKQQQTASGKNKLKAKKKGIFTSATKAEMNYNFYGIPALCLERKKNQLKFIAFMHSSIRILLFIYSLLFTFCWVGKPWLLLPKNEGTAAG